MSTLAQSASREILGENEVTHSVLHINHSARQSFTPNLADMLVCVSPHVRVTAALLDPGALQCQDGSTVEWQHATCWIPQIGRPGSTRACQFGKTRAPKQSGSILTRRISLSGLVALLLGRHGDGGASP